MAVRRVKYSETVLDKLKERGFNVGELKWKAPREYRSITYNQSGFDVDSNTGRTDHATVELSKIGTFHLTFHRPLPSNADIKEVILKEQKRGDWTASIMVEYDADYPETPAVEDIDVEDTVGIDLGITKFIHDSDGRAFRPLDEGKDRERIEKRHQAVALDSTFSDRGHASAYYRTRSDRSVETLKVTTLTDTESLAVLDVQCYARERHDTRTGPQIVRRNADDLHTVVADNGFQDWHTECEIAAHDLAYLVHYRGSSLMATANNALLRSKGYSQRWMAETSYSTTKRSLGDAVRALD